MIDIKKIRNDFPILTRTIQGKTLVYLDNAATTQKPRQVIDAIVEYYERHNANVHRGVHTLSDQSTKMYEGARATIANFIGARDPFELVFVRNTTEAINLVAYSWGREHIGEGDEILISELEHHSNIVPWQLLVDRQKAKLRFVRVDKTGRLDLWDLHQKLSERTKLVAVAHVSNFLGTINPVREIAEVIKHEARSAKHEAMNKGGDIRFLQPSSRSGLSPSGRSGRSGSDEPSGSKNSAESSDSKRSKTFGPCPLFLVDGAQAVGHMPVDVKELGCDCYAFSGHKMYGPMGIGGLWAKREILELMPPFLTGGGMISKVTTERTTFAELPDKFDAGTPNVADAVGLAAAVRYLRKIGMEKVREHERELTRCLLGKISPFVISSAVERSSDSDKNISIASLDSSTRRRLLARNDKLRVTIFGPKNVEGRGGLVTFTLHLNGKEIHSHDVAQVLDSEGIEVRSGHHCTMPMHTKLGLAATTRVSFGIYNTKEDVDKLMNALEKVEHVFG